MRSMPDKSVDAGRSLHWERGLKLQVGLEVTPALMSLPSLGAWIETMLQILQCLYPRVAPFIGSVD